MSSHISFDEFCDTVAVFGIMEQSSVQDLCATIHYIGKLLVDRCDAILEHTDVFEWTEQRWESEFGSHGSVMRNVFTSDDPLAFIRDKKHDGDILHTVQDQFTDFSSTHSSTVWYVKELIERMDNYCLGNAMTHAQSQAKASVIYHDCLRECTAADGSIDTEALVTMIQSYADTYIQE